MAKDLVVPTLGESVTEATVSKWLKQVGDPVKADEPVVELETDKVSVAVPSPEAGVLSEIKIQAGSTVNVGAVLGSIGAGTATLTLSVSNSTTGSSAFTASPTFFNHLETVASVTDSPSVGTTKSFAIIL